MPEPDAARARVLALVRIAARIADPSDALGQEARRELSQALSSSPEGVELALRDHLETHPSSEEIDRLLASVRPAPRCHVVLSANVCTAALRAIALAAATSPEVFVKPSRRDPVLAGLFVRELRASADWARLGANVELVPSITPRAGDVVHAYGADDTLVAIASSLPEGASFIGHGTGFGVAIVESGDSLDDAANAVARDVVAFDQRGCLSPRLTLVDGETRARAFARSLDEALAREGRRVPRAVLDPFEAAEIAGYVELMRSVGDVREGESYVVGLDLEPESIWIGPPCRVMHVVAVTRDRVAPLLSPVADQITTIGGVDEGALVGEAARVCRGARVTRLGEMQRPPFDGPVDRRPPRTNANASRFSG